MGYFRVRYEAKRLANYVSLHGRSYAKVEEFCDTVRQESGLNIYTSDVSVFDEDGRVFVHVEADFPAALPGLNKSLDFSHTVKVDTQKKSHF